MLYARALRNAGLIVAGPLGCSTLYYLAFVVRNLDADRYPALAAYYGLSGIVLETVFFFMVLAGCAYYLRAAEFAPFRKTRPSLHPAVLTALTFATAALMALTVYRVFGTIDPTTLMADYGAYYAKSRVGGAWMILAGYGILFIFLADMFFGGVNRANAVAFLACIILNFVTGGRGMLLVLMLAFLFMLYFQRPRLPVMLAAVAACLTIGVLSYTLVSELRVEGEVQQDVDAADYSPTKSSAALNYNAAFILNDVIAKMDAGEIEPEAHTLNDFALLTPRFLAPNKPKSDSETRLVYPDVAEHGTTISFPLKANLMLHFGSAAFYSNWLVAAFFQVCFIWAVMKRQTEPTIPAFIAFFWGCVFSEIARAGVMNYRIVLLTAILGLAYGCYRLASARSVGFRRLRTGGRSIVDREIAEKRS